ncbi:MAG: hypothetical protein ACOX6S_12805 [Clostridia bacterium]|jgi:hypothetical protein
MLRKIRLRKQDQRYFFRHKTEKGDGKLSLGQPVSYEEWKAAQEKAEKRLGLL